MRIKVVAIVLLCALAGASIVAAEEPAISAQKSTASACRCHAAQARPAVEVSEALSAQVADASLQTLIAAIPEPTEPNVEEVEVIADPLPGPVSEPEIPPGLLAIFWAFTRPTQAWRILVPLSPERAAELNGPPDATDPYRPTNARPQ